MNKNEVKDQKQKEALELAKAEERSLVIGATGFGKSKIGVDYAKDIVKLNPNARIIISVPTEKLRDENWKEEFEKWGALDIWDNNIERSCYASINKIEGEEYDLFIGDEFHNITELNSGFFAKNRVAKAIALTATEPKDKVKLKVIKDLGFKKVFELNLDEAVELGLVSPYEIVVIEISMDDKDKYIIAGSKAKPFSTTEVKQYKYLSDVIRRLMFSNNANDKKQLTFKILDRMRFIYNLRSKTQAAQYFLDNVISKEERTLIFAGGIEQAELLSEYSFHSKSKSSKSFDDFKSEKINRLSCVQALNEGQNIPNIQNALVVQLNSKDLDLVQRIGRIIRYREGHIGKVIILGAIGTKDMDWINNALESFDKSKIKYVRYENIVSGNVVL